MVDSALLGKLGEQAPYMVLIVVLVFGFLYYIEKQNVKTMAHEKEMEKTRTENAKEREKERRDHELTIANMQANNMKQLIDSVKEMTETFTSTVESHEKASQTRYEKMNITKDLLTAAKEEMRRNK